MTDHFRHSRTAAAGVAVRAHLNPLWGGKRYTVKHNPSGKACTGVLLGFDDLHATLRVSPYKCVTVPRTLSTFTEEPTQ